MVIDVKALESYVKCVMSGGYVNSFDCKKCRYVLSSNGFKVRCNYPDDSLSDVEDYVRTFEGIFGESDELKILENFLPFEEEIELKMVEIAQFSEVSIEKTVEAIDKFVKFDIVKILISPSEWVKYKINIESNIVKSFDRINLDLIEKILNANEE